MRETQGSRMWEKNEAIRKGSKWTMTTPKSNDFIPTHLSLVDLRSQYTLWRLGFLWLSFLNIKSQWTWFTNTSFPSFGMLLWGNCCRCVCELTYQCGSVKSTTKKDRFFNFTLKKLLSYLKISLLLFSQVWIFHKSWELTQTFFLYHFFLPLTEAWENWGSEKCLIQLTQRNTGQIRVKSLGLCYPVLHCYLSISSEKCCQDPNPSLGCARDIQHKPGQAVVWWHNGPDLVKFSP